MVFFLKPLYVFSVAGVVGVAETQNEFASLVQSTRLLSETIAADGDFSRSRSSHRDKQQSSVVAAAGDLEQIGTPEFDIILRTENVPAGWKIANYDTAKANEGAVTTLVNDEAPPGSKVTLSNGYVLDGRVRKWFYCRKCLTKLIFKLPEETGPSVFQVLDLGVPNPQGWALATCARLQDHSNLDIVQDILSSGAVAALVDGKVDQDGISCDGYCTSCPKKVLYEILAPQFQGSLLEIETPQFDIMDRAEDVPDGWEIADYDIAKANEGAVKTLVSDEVGQGVKVTLSNGYVSNRVRKWFYCRKCEKKLIYKLPEETGPSVFQVLDRGTENPEGWALADCERVKHYLDEEMLQTILVSPDVATMTDGRVWLDGIDCDGYCTNCPKKILYEILADEFTN